MKLVFKRYREYCTTKFRKETRGVFFIGDVNDEDEFFNLVRKEETIFKQDNGDATDPQGNVVYDANYPDEFDFGDYSYELFEPNQMWDKHRKAVMLANPWNLNEIV